MHRRVTPLFLLIGFTVWSLPVAGIPQEPPTQKATQSKKAEPKGTTAMNGCMDEQNGQYVLIHDQTRDLIANLEAEGFPTKNFAKYVGHKVTVRGISGPNDARPPVFKVRSVETVSETCGSQQH